MTRRDAGYDVMGVGMMAEDLRCGRKPHARIGAGA